jgi:two-component sensor histidine kinase
VAKKRTYEELEQRGRDSEREIVERMRFQDALWESDRELSIRNKIAQIFLSTSDDEMYGEVLQVVLEAIESKYGTFAYIDENGDRVVPSMTRGIWDQCKIREKDIFFPRDTWGNNLWARCLIEKRAISCNGPFKVPDGHIPITRALAVPIIHQGEVIGNFMVGNKATDYDQRDEELLKTIADHTAPILNAWLQRERQEKVMRSLARFPSENPNPVLRVAKDGTVLYSNKVSSALLETWGCQVSQCLPDEWCKIILDVLGCGVSKATEIQCGDRVFSLTFAPVIKAGYVNLYGLDITERKLAEEQIKASLKEKEVLLREVHHRVKNNMQVIISLLRLQAASVKDKKFSDLLKESQDRIQSMALIHEKLYRSEDFARVDFDGYLRGLARELFRSYGIDRSKIALKTEFGGVSLGLDNAVPCALIINELISNSLKHAFPEEREGEIEIAFHSTKGEDVELRVGDNGIGLPRDLDFRNTESLGLNLVTILAENQLRGSIELDSTGGTKFLIRFKRTPDKVMI